MHRVVYCIPAKHKRLELWFMQHQNIIKELWDTSGSWYVPRVMRQSSCDVNTPAATILLCSHELLRGRLPATVDRKKNNA